MIYKKKLHEWVIAPYEQDRKDARASEDIPCLYHIDCHRYHRGPYTGAGELLRKIVPHASRHRPDLVLTHAITILSVAPELGKIIPVSEALNMSFTVTNGESYFYPHKRTLRLAHGLVDFLLAYFSQIEKPLYQSIVLENVHMAEPLDQEFIAVLLRRADPGLLFLSIGTGSDLLPELLLSALQTYAQVVQPSPLTMDERQEVLSLCQIPETWSAWLLHYTAGWKGEWLAWKDLAQELDSSILTLDASSLDGCLSRVIKQLPFALRYKLARTYVEANCALDNPLMKAAYENIPLSLRQRLHEEQVSTLEKLQQQSLRLGAILFHYERVRPEVYVEQGTQAFLSACEFCLIRGYYQAALDIGSRGQALVDAERQSRQYWLFTRATLISLLLLGRLPEAEDLCNRLQNLISDPSILMNCAYLMAILYSRFYAQEKRDNQLARKWLQVAIEYAELLDSEEKKQSNITFLAKNTWALTEMRKGLPHQAIELLSEGLESLRAEAPRKNHRYQRDIEILLYNRARVYTMTKQWKLALEDYNALIGLGTYVSEYYFHRAAVLRILGQYAEALEDYNSAITWSPPYPEVYYNRAGLFADLERSDDAFTDYARVLELDPDSVDALINYVGLLYERKAFTTARKQIEHGLTLSPDNAHLLCMLGLLEMEEHHMQESHQAFSHALKSEPTLLAAWINRAALLFEEGKTEAAIDDLTHALRLSEDATTRYNRALAYQSQKRWQEAIDDYSHALTLPHADVQTIHAQREQCYQALKGQEAVHWKVR